MKVPVIAVLLFGFWLPAFAHAILLHATPGLRETVNGPDVAVKLQFNVRIDARRSQLLLLPPQGEQRVLYIHDGSPPDSLQAEAKGLPGGNYILRWQVLASDGHISRGEVPFQVH